MVRFDWLLRDMGEEEREMMAPIKAIMEIRPPFHSGVDLGPGG